MKNLAKEIECIEGYRENWINFDIQTLCRNEIKDNESQKKKFKKKNERKQRNEEE